jgi:four helix bundle protein
MGAMSTPRSFEDTEAWKAARALTQKAYALCRREPLALDFGLSDQLRRAAVSVMNNLAEGWESIHLAEKRQVYGYARRSCGEVRSMSYVLLDNCFISASEQDELMNHCRITGKLITGLIHSVERR